MKENIDEKKVKTKDALYKSTVRETYSQQSGRLIV